MGNVMRYRQDGKRTAVPVDSATVIEVGDMCYLNTDDALPASTAALWSADQATTAALLKNDFLGIAMTASPSGETEPVIFAHSGAVFEMDADSDSYVIGAEVGGMKDTGGNFLYDQQVIDAATAAGAIGIVAEDAPASSTRILVRVYSQVLDGIKIGE